MAYKDILVVLDRGARTGTRVKLAARLAERFAAHLVGLYAAVEPTADLVSVPDVSSSSRSQPRTLEWQGWEGAETLRNLFEDIAGRHNLSAEWRPARGDPAELAGVHGRAADLIVLGQRDPDEIGTGAVQPRPEDVALHSGRPILVIPYAGTFEEIGWRALVGWDGSRAATRAVHDAMPLLAGASVATILTIDPQTSRQGHGGIPGVDIVPHLARHGVRAAVERASSAGIDVGNALLSRASDLGADLLVMGAYGHSRARELLLGGVTRTVLASMTLPVLMAH